MSPFGLWNKVLKRLIRHIFHRIYLFLEPDGTREGGFAEQDHFR